jgi:hypothetical protein
LRRTAQIGHLRAFSGIIEPARTRAAVAWPFSSVVKERKREQLIAPSEEPRALRENVLSRASGSAKSSKLARQGRLRADF